MSRPKTRAGTENLISTNHDMIRLVRACVISPFKFDSRLKAEKAALRHQVMVLQSRVRLIKSIICSFFRSIAGVRRACGSAPSFKPGEQDK